MDDKWAGQALKIQLEGLLSPTKFCTRLGCSMRWHVEVALRTMYLLMVGKIGLRLVNCDNRVLLALSRLRRRIVNNTTQTGTANAQKRIEALPRSIGQEILYNRSELSLHLAMLGKTTSRWTHWGISRACNEES